MLRLYIFRLLSASILPRVWCWPIIDSIDHYFHSEDKINSFLSLIWNTLAPDIRKDIKCPHTSFKDDIMSTFFLDFAHKLDFSSLKRFVSH